MKTIILTAALALSSSISFATETYYISDTQYVPLRSGPNSTFRISHRGLPSGTEMIVNKIDKESGYSFITTAKGTKGWIRSQYLMKEKTAAMKITAVRTMNQTLSKKNNQLNLELNILKKDNTTLNTKLIGTAAQLKSTNVELGEIRRISSKALTLDKNNELLTNSNEMLKNELELTRADNKRMRSNKENEAFLNGVFAVVFGVILAIIIPRLWPKKRRHSEWA